MAASLSRPRAAAPVRWTAYVLETLVVLFLAFDFITKFTRPQPVVDAFARLGAPIQLSPAIGTLLAICTLVYVIPRTRIFGAILLTGYLGGAVSIQLRAATPMFETIFPVLFAVLAWAPVYLLDARVRELIPISKGDS